MVKKKSHDNNHKALQVERLTKNIFLKIKVKLLKH